MGFIQLRNKIFVNFRHSAYCLPTAQTECKIRKFCCGALNKTFGTMDPILSATVVAIAQLEIDLTLMRFIFISEKDEYEIYSVFVVWKKCSIEWKPSNVNLSDKMAIDIVCDERWEMSPALSHFEMNSPLCSCENFTFVYHRHSSVLRFTVAWIITMIIRGIGNIAARVHCTYGWRRLKVREMNS